VIVCGQQFSEETLKWIQGTIEAEPVLSRVGLSRRVCGKLNWRSANGKLKEMSCRVALLKLERRGVIELGAVKRPAPKRQRKTICEEVSRPEPIECSFRELGRVELVRVASADSEASRLWNEFMERYHYLGSGPLCGAQLRYLISSAEGKYLGALAFSAAAWRVKARDGWIGWSDGARGENLSKVVCNSRFLILPWVRVKNLASHVLSQSMRRLGADWKERYGFAPVVVETFVESGRFKATSYRAANWVCVGQSVGRGRQDRRRAFSLPQKDVYVYALTKHAREVLCRALSKAQSNAQSEASGGENHQDWAEKEFGGARLNDERLSKRLLTVARDFYDRPQANIPEACQSRAKTRAAYRFLGHPKVGMEKLLEPHYEATLKRISQEQIVLVAQDTTSLNYSTHPATVGLGPISTQPQGVVGLLLHDSMAFNLAGTPLGLLDVQCWARDPKQFHKKQFRHELPIEQKESQKWLSAYGKVAEAVKRCPNTTLVSVGDREADIYELFHLALGDPSGAHLLVRAEHNRQLAEEQGRLWEQIEAEPVAGIEVISVPRQAKRAPREACLEVRFKEVRLKPPQRKADLGEIAITAILAQETQVPEGAEPIQWMLLTTMAVTNFDQATEKLSWYAKRWGIEVYHRTLKSGCKIEERQLGSADRIEACLAIDMVVAWRIFHLTKLGRETPDVPCTVFFEDTQWKALYCFVKQQPTPPEQPPTLREATHMMASLGGHLGRKSDGEPGTKSLWIGIQRLDDIEATWKFMAQHFAPHLLSPPVSRKPDYG
jgi:hypothetical protein